MSDEFKDYQKQIVKNAKALAAALMNEGFKLVSDGTDNHLMLLDLRDTELTGKAAEHMLDEVGGVRLGTPAVTSRGMKEEDMKEIAALIALTLNSFEEKKEEVINRVKALTEKYPLYE